MTWEAANERCSVFPLVMLHWVATFAGAMPRDQTAAADEWSREQLDRGWTFVGEVNGLRAYNHPDKTICFLK